MHGHGDRQRQLENTSMAGRPLAAAARKYHHGQTILSILSFLLIFSCWGIDEHTSKIGNSERWGKYEREEHV
jgi:hypothetical protein